MGYPTFFWANKIKVIVGTEDLEVSGIIPVFQEDQNAAPDPLRAYRHAVSRYAGPKRQGKNSPHIQFANADNSQKQIAFVRQYGPVIVSSSRTEERAIPSEFSYQMTETVIIALQNLEELEREHLVYRSAFVLLAELQRGKKSDIAIIRECASTIDKYVSEWPRQWKREQQLRANGQGYADRPQWLFGADNLEHLEIWAWNAMRETTGDELRDLMLGPDTIRAGHLLLCELVNAFAPVVYPWGDVPVEAPGLDLTGGIRPILYYILRREYLQRGGVAICRNTDCRALFEIERAGQEFCGEECSRLHRQREYWRTRGKKLRKRKRTTKG